MRHGLQIPPPLAPVGQQLPEQLVERVPVAAVLEMAELVDDNILEAR